MAAAAASLGESSSAPFVLRELINNVPLSADGEHCGSYITCVELWEGNLYIGTSASEILHFVSIPPDPSSDSEDSVYILASRTQPEYNAPKSSSDPLPGVEQLLLLPLVNKACILCNGTLTFYSLPELSPAFGGKIKQGECTGVGGIDRNLDLDQANPADGVVIVVCLKQRLRLIRIGEQQARTIRNIEVGSCLDLARRSDLACVADCKTYALLDVVNQQKIDLFPISSAPHPPERSGSPDTGDLPALTRPTSRSFSSRSPVRRLDLHSHERVSSLGSQPRDRLRPESPSAWPARRSSRSGASKSPSRAVSPAIEPSDGRPALQGSPWPSPQADAKPAARVKPLAPHVASPTANEFLLTTGTSADEPGVGIFVNLDGDVVRGTVEFSTYPESVVVDGRGTQESPSQSADSNEEGYVLAIVRRDHDGSRTRALQLQRWDLDPGETQTRPQFMSIPSTPEDCCINLRRPLTGSKLALPAVGQALSLRRMQLLNPEAPDTDVDVKRNAEEDHITARFAGVESRVLLSAGDKIWWVTRNPLLFQLDQRLETAMSTAGTDIKLDINIQRAIVEQVINSVRGQEPRDEFEFLTLSYIRQKASLLLLIDVMLKTARGTVVSSHDKRTTDEALVSGDLDPRIVLSLIPSLSEEVIEGQNGIWTFGGLRHMLNTFKQHTNADAISSEPKGLFEDNILYMLKQFLSAWRRKKGFGSVADEHQVFQTVDAALLHLLLLLDKHSPRGAAVAGSLRADLNDVVDHGVDCFERAVTLLEQHNRLYVLSRLYQSRKMAPLVLATWKRILDGEHDEGGELVEGESAMRKYLSQIRDAKLVRDYGTWLAARNPKLGVQIFADDTARVKFTPPEAVALLKERAPSAVKEYLEHLVFGKHNHAYVNDLITYYLDTVLDALSSPASPARDNLASSYTTYRALRPPKPTYRQFITDNAADEPWSRARLRLLQLIGGSHDSASTQYDVAALTARLAPYSDLLVPEMMILNARRGAHVEALRLLVHGLGDYDTAIRYCLRGSSSSSSSSSSIFQPSGPGTTNPSSASPEHRRQEQERLFRTLLDEFLRLDDAAEREERCAELLARFGAWFDVADVLALVPAHWAVDVLGGFLVHALRRLVRERNETVVVKALAGAQNLRRSKEFVEKVEGMGVVVVRDGGGGDGGGVQET